jgi:Plasmid encoded RepA protein
MCQVGMPRRKVDGRSFTRTSGAVSLKIDAGELWDGRAWQPQPLPYGTRPRLVMVHISSEAVRTQSRDIEVGHSIRGFLEELGIGTSGGRTGPFTAFKKQMMALAACRLSIGMSAGARVATVDAKPIEKFEAWMHPTGAQRTLWPGTLVLSERFYETLVAHAVPLDKRALAVLKHSALALDTYSWLAHRLCRINRADGVKVSWSQGAAHLEVQAGRALHPKREEFVEIGLPWGAKPRLILAHLSGEALRRGSPEVDVGDNLTGFVKRIRGFDGGREIRSFKDQLGRLSAALIRVAFAHGGRAFQVETKWSRSSTCGSPRMSGSACFGPHTSASRSTTSTA